MDKRWILVIAILIIGFASLYIIADTSNNVGNAIASVDGVIVTLPPDFTNFQAKEKSVNIENKYTYEKLYFKSIADGDHAYEQYNNTIKDLDNDEDIEITNKTTMKVDNVTAYVIYYQNSSSGEAKEYIKGYFYDYDTTFVVTMWNFNSTERGNSNLKFVIENLYPDYKKPDV